MADGAAGTATETAPVRRRQTDRVMNLGRFLTQAAQRFPDRLALAKGDRTVTWAALNARVDALAHGLVARGIRPGDHVMLHANNTVEMVEAMYAVFKTGAVLVPTNFRLSPADIGKLAASADIVALIGTAAFPDHPPAVAAACPDLKATVILSGDAEELIAAHTADGPFREAAVLADDPAWFFFTSGTTGLPKAGMLTHGQLAFVIVNHIADLMPGLHADRDVSLAVAPLSHGAGMHLFVQVARAVPTILLATDSLDPAEVWALVARYRVTNMFTVPTIVKRLVEHPAVAEHDTSSLRHVIYAGAPMYRADQKKALSVLGPVLVQYFGLGEVTGAITVLEAGDHSVDDDKMPVGSCGIPRTGMDVAILDDAGKPLPPNTTGNIAAAGPAVCAGYYNNPKANAEAFVDGWFVTGDVGHLDARGYLYITGRRSDMYISGGSNVYPREVEEVLLTHPAVAEVGIVGVPDPDWGEVGAAVLVLSEPVETADLDAWLKTRIAGYKRPRHYAVWEALPKSGYGKVEKKRLKQLLAEAGTIPGLAP